MSPPSLLVHFSIPLVVLLKKNPIYHVNCQAHVDSDLSFYYKQVWHCSKAQQGNWLGNVLCVLQGMFGQMELGLEVRQNIGHDMVLYRTKVLMLYTCYLKIVSQLPTRILCKFHNSTARLKICDCGNQLALAMQQIEAAGRGVLVYLRGHEGRGIGLGHKLRAYNLQDDGRDTVEANEELGLPVDSREYGIGAQILRDLGVQSMKLMTNNPSKYIGLKGYGLTVSGRIPLLTLITSENKRYLETKRVKMGHIYGTEHNSANVKTVSVEDSNLNGVTSL
ncbi:Bifunctional riboflavin biosynthesis protein RIBA 1 [Lathyrus oleraceus]|uniref:GTP cyclohydrolase II n=1 Tax=Pisum sativum TaxID=3888 RepID=A0A9D4WD09_PEA|nr:Bifunctional riboflavin biosynthesis protein RIBA 1 [Pisum sativum]